MEAKTTEWRPGPTVCRCCLTEGCYKDISTEYFWMGKREVYSEMLSETLDLNIAYSQSGGPNSNSRLICEPCISRLRDATDFKRQVLECERSFMQYLDPVGSGEIGVTIELEKDVKIERVKDEKTLLDDDDDEFVPPDFGDEDDDDLDDQPLTKLASKIPKKESVDVLDLLDNAKISEKRKSSSKSKSSPAKKSKLKKEVASSSKVKPEPRKKKANYDPERRNAELIIKYTTSLPFRININTVLCVYCGETFEDPNVFRSHMEEEHSSFLLDLAFRHLTKAEFVKVDISTIYCRICAEAFESLELVAAHLKLDHRIALHMDSKIGVIPFQLQGEKEWICCVCSKNVPSLLLLSKHTVSHFQNFVCDLCGKSYIAATGLLKHVKSKHQDEYKVHCRRCRTSFTSLKEKICHQRTVKHCMPHVCMECPERFPTWETKQRHLVQIHGKRPTKDIDGLTEKERKQKKGLFERSVKHNPQRRNAVLILRHSSAIPFKTRFNRILCSYCHDEFEPMDALRVHIKETHTNADFNSAFYKVVDDLKIDISHFKCNLCSQDIENVETFMIHLSRDHGKTVNFEVPFGVLPYRQNETGAWMCLHCEKIYPEFSQMNGHLRTHAKISTCDKCGATFLSEHGLKQHERNFQCYKATYKPRFGKALKHKFNTEIILQCSTACPFRTWGQNFNCVFCRVQSNDPNGLRAHMAARHANFDVQLVFSRKLRKEFLKVDITDLQCKLCFMHIDTLDDLLTHLKNDHKQPVNVDVQPGVLPFKLNDGSCWKCAICKIQFSDFISLKKHTAEHYQNYVCDTCGEGFITEVALRAHTKIPHDNKYTCSRCVATFSTLEERNIHMKTQHTNLPYMCTYCKDKPRFATWELRKRHLYEIHNYKSGAEMYECTTCHMMFKTRSQKYHHNVKVHRTKKEIDFGFSCGHCARGFTTKLSLDRHIAKKHFHV